MKVVDFKMQKHTNPKHKPLISRETKKASKVLRSYRKNRHDIWNPID